MKQLSDHIKPYDHAEAILSIVASTLKLTLQELNSKSRITPLADARKIYAYLAKTSKVTYIPFNVMGEVINRDHATMIWSVREAKNLYETDRAFASKIKECQAKFNDVFDCLDVSIFNNIPQY